MIFCIRSRSKYMKKIFRLSISIIIILCLNSCSYNKVKNDEVAINETQATIIENSEITTDNSIKDIATEVIDETKVEETTTEEMQEEEIESIELNFGDVIEKENLKMTIDSAEIFYDLVYEYDGGTSSYSTQQNMKVFSLVGTIENLSSYSIEEFYTFIGYVEADGKYNYRLTAWSPFDLPPLSESPIYIFAEVPQKMVDSYETATFYFGFMNDLSDLRNNWEIEDKDIDNIYRINVAK